LLEIQTPEVQAIVETAIYVDDLERAAAFYRDVLGLVASPGANERHVFFPVGDRMLLLFNPRETLRGETLPSHGTTGAAHFALGIRPQDLDAWRARLAEHRVAIEQEVDWPRGGKSLYFRDPAGNSVELITPGVWRDPPAW
jgi:catechol 2,3-dioxygenase-like lactoylglutathione lyase family enzyme